MKNTDILFDVNESLSHLLILFDAFPHIHHAVTDGLTLGKADTPVI